MTSTHPTAQRLPDGPTLVPGLADVAAALKSVGYTVDALGRLLHVEGELSGRPADVVVYRRRIAADPGPLADIVALFALGLSVTRQDLVAAFGNRSWAALVESGCIVDDGGDAVATIRIIPHGNLLIASDLRPVPGMPPEPLHVTGINAPAGLLASLTVRSNVGTALDIGTGNGIQALLAAHHAQNVIATDVNPRALGFAAFNAALNGIGNIEFRRGSLFEPVAGSQFDLIVCNPPYVISPDSDFVYRDSGSSPAAMCRAIVAALPAHLAAGGFATVLASWPSTPGADWAAVPRSWIGENCLAWLLHYRAEDPLTHAAAWNKPIAESDVEGYAAAVDRWLAFDRAQGIEEISFGAVVVQRKDGVGQVLRCDMLRAGHGSASAQIERVFRAHADPAGTASTADGDFLDQRFRLADGNRLEQSLRPVDGDWQAEPARLVVTEGIGFEGTLDGVMVQVLLLLDGSMTARQAAQAVANQLETPDAASVMDVTEQMVRELYGRGLLETFG
jgi:methylase of polypeptide subunit release factors